MQKVRNNQYQVKAKGNFIYKFSNVESRPNKVAKGFTKHYERGAKYGKENMNPDIGSLMVRGTTDILSKRTHLAVSLSKKVMKEHPIDKGYFKQVYVLSDAGKRLLKQKKR